MPNYKNINRLRNPLPREVRTVYCIFLKSLIWRKSKNLEKANERNVCNMPKIWKKIILILLKSSKRTGPLQKLKKFLWNQKKTFSSSLSMLSLLGSSHFNVRFISPKLWNKANCSSIAYITLTPKIILHSTGCGRMKGPTNELMRLPKVSAYSCVCSKHNFIADNTTTVSWPG